MKRLFPRALLCLALVVSVVMVASCGPKPAVSEPSGLSLPPVFQDVMSVQDLTSNGLSKIYRSSPFPSRSNIATLDLTLDAKLPKAPATMTVYRIIPPEIDYEYAIRLARQLGFNSEPEIKQHGDLAAYYFSGGDRGLNVLTDGSIQYIDNNRVIYGAQVPSSSESIRFAQDWLKSLGLYPEAVLRTETTSASILVTQLRATSTDGKTVTPTTFHVDRSGEYQFGVTINFIIGVDGYELDGMGASVVVGQEGKVLEASIKLPKLEPYTTATMKRPEDAVALLRFYLAAPTSFAKGIPECLIDNFWDVMAVSESSIKYFCMIGIDDTQSIYAQPIYVFRGKQDTPFDARVDGLTR